jgi:hypothetical protein
MAAPKGQPKPESSGRKKGVVNKTTADIKEMINNALHLAGGEDYLVRQADENPVAFMGLIGKILPKQVDLDANVNGNLNISKIVRSIIDPINNTNS